MVENFGPHLEQPVLSKVSTKTTNKREHRLAGSYAPVDA